MNQNFTTLVKKLPQDAPAEFPHMFALCSSQRLADELPAFFGPLVPRYEGLAKSLNQSLETVRVCASSRDAQQAGLSAYLKQGM